MVFLWFVELCRDTIVAKNLHGRLKSEHHILQHSETGPPRPSDVNVGWIGAPYKNHHYMENHGKTMGKWWFNGI